LFVVVLMVVDRVINLYGNDVTVENTIIEANTYPGGGFPFNT